MSDAKAAAAARRAKILARDKSRLDIAKGLKDALEDKPEEVAAEIKERPLAYRRRFVKKIKDDDADDEDADDNKDDIKETKSDSDNKDETISLLNTDDNNSKDTKNETVEKKTDSDENTTTTDSEVKIGSIRNRRRKPVKNTESESSGGMISEVTKRVEREIAEATKNHETKIRNDDDSKSEKNMAIKRRRAQLKANLLQPLQSYQILKMARVLVIIILGCFTGFKFASTGTQTIAAANNKFRENAGIAATSIVSDLQASKTGADVYNSLQTFLSSRYHKDKSIQWGSLMKRLNLQLQDSGQYDNEFDESVIFSVIKEDSKDNSGTWIGWFKGKLYQQLDSTFCALGIVWWLAKVLAYFLEKIAKDNKSAAPAEKTNILQTVFKFISEGFDALLEMIYESVGEMALYTVAVIVSSSFIILVQNSSNGGMNISNQIESIIMMEGGATTLSSIEDEL